MNNTIIENILTYLMKLTNKHTKLSGFYLGQRSDLNDNSYESPFIFVELPIRIGTVNFEPIRNNGGQFSMFELTLNIGCWTKLYEDDNSNTMIVTDETSDYQGNIIKDKGSVLNEINQINPIYMGETHRYLSHLIGKLVEDIDDNTPLINQFTYSNSQFQTRIAAFSDRFVGTECQLTLRVNNSYNCELDAYFNN